AGIYHLSDGQKKTSDSLSAGKYQIVSNNVLMYTRNANKNPELTTGIIEIELVDPASKKDDEKRPLTAKELTGKWFGEAENKDGIRKLEATLDFDILVPRGPEVRCSLRYSTPVSTSAAAQKGMDLAMIDDGTTGRVNLWLRFTKLGSTAVNKAELGHLARGENGTLLLTVLPEIEKGNMKDELLYRRFQGLVLRRVEDEKKPLTAKELTGKWYGEAENKDGIRKLTATFDFDIKFGGDVKWRLRYETEESNGAEIPITGHRVENSATGRVDLHFKKTVLGHLARGEGDTILLTILPEFETKNMPGERRYRRFEGLVLRREQGEKKPLTAKELTGKWFGEAENKDGIKKISANVNFDIKYGGDVHWDLRYESESRVSTPGIDGHRVENAATGRVDLHFRKTVFGHLERGEGDTILLTMLPEFENLYRRDGDELFYRRFEGLVLRRQEEPKEQAKPSDRPGDSAR
ncbi:MAG: hypothetical protein ACKVP0_24640, partial [Pirellulaceae bacterium]